MDLETFIKLKSSGNKILMFNKTHDYVCAA